MSLYRWLNSLGELGVKPGYLPWEKYLTRNLNYITLASIGALLMGIATYISLGNYHFIREHAIAIALLPLIIFINARVNYIWALYFFYLIILSLLFFFTLKMGEECEPYLFLIPLTISLLMLIRRKEIQKNVIALFVILFAFLLIGIIGYKLTWFDSTLSHPEIVMVRGINIFFSSFLTLIVTGIIVNQNSKQELELNALLKEKETLLAEINHRVKNNMNVITSLLNLKKDLCATDEAREALEDSKHRVYSMALIHQKVYGSSSVRKVDFQEYISELAEELVSSYSLEKSVKLNIQADDCLLGLDVAVPCSLIINEVLTNSLKHAYRKGATLKLSVIIKKNENAIEIIMSDNGPGFANDEKPIKDSLGITLIELLCGQLEASYSFKNQNGLVFTANFNLPK
jgi:two-component sensor histidine kinase